MAHCGWGWIYSLPPTSQTELITWHTPRPSGTRCWDKTSRFTRKDNTITPKKPSVVWGPDKHFLSFSNMKGKWQQMGFQLLMFLEVQGPVIAPDRLGFPQPQPLETILNSELFLTPRSIYSTICIIPGSFPWQGKKKTKNKPQQSSNQALLLFYSWLETKLTKRVHLSAQVIVVLLSVQLQQRITGYLQLNNVFGG